MKYPGIIVTTGAALLFALSAESASAMDQEVSRRIRQAWSEDKDTSGAEAFRAIVPIGDKTIEAMSRSRPKE